MHRIAALGCWFCCSALACGSATTKSDFDQPGESAGSGGASAAGKGGASTSGGAAGSAGGASAGGPSSGGFQGGGFNAGGAASGAGGSAGGGAECAGVTEKADLQKLPADIIWAIDTSGSMDEETAQVKNKMNAFAGGILQTGIDVRVVLVAEKLTCPFGNCNPPLATGMCLPAPLGSGMCPNDSKAPYYLHVMDEVASTDALLVLKSSFPNWQGMLRKNSIKHVVVVTDDDATSPPYGAKADLPTWIKDMTALDPLTMTGFKLSSIYCFSSCPAAANEGKQWRELVKLTGGVEADLCKQDFQPIFNELAKAIVTGAQLSCTWKIPAPPPGQAFDSGKVNVEHHHAGAVDQVGYAKTLADCSPTQGGWYYDDPTSPTTVQACPATCAKIQADASAEVRISFGCQTRVIDPE